MSDTTLGPVEPYRDFEEASSAVLQLLQEHVGLGLWIVTRRDEDDWIILTAQDRSYGVKNGDVLRWSDSFCSRMVQGLGPNFAPIAAEVACYATAPIADQLTIGAYVGVPLRRSDGRLFGTLCAIDPEPQPAELEAHMADIITYSRLLSTILSTELEHQESLRKIEVAELEAETDPLTGLLNRRAWDRLLDSEEKRCQRYGSPAGIVVLDLNNLKEVNDQMGHAAGDRLLKRTAGVLSASLRETDTLARVGGDEFAILAPDESALALEQLESRLRERLSEAGVDAAIGSARRDPRGDLQATLGDADKRMLLSKKAGKGKSN